LSASSWLNPQLTEVEGLLGLLGLLELGLSDSD